MMQKVEWAAVASRALHPTLSIVVADVRQAACQSFARSASHLEPNWIAPLLNDAEPAASRQVVANIVRDYDPYKIMAVDGRVLNGIIVSETQSDIELQQANGEKQSLQRVDIEQIAISEVSVMPAGLDQALSELELLDVVKYLQSLK